MHNIAKCIIIYKWLYAKKLLLGKDFDFMKLWTVQPYCIYELIQKEGIYRCNLKKSEHIELDGFVDAYEWISNQMKKKIGNPPNEVEYPVWAWYLYEGKNKRPDMRLSGLKVTEKSVLLEIEVPDNEVLLTNFDGWHFILNDDYFINYYNVTSDEEWEREMDKEDAFYDSLSEEEKKVYKRNSWEQIICSPETSISYVQATFWELKASQIKRVWILKK